MEVDSRMDSPSTVQELQSQLERLGAASPSQFKISVPIPLDSTNIVEALAHLQKAPLPGANSRFAGQPLLTRHQADSILNGKGNNLLCDRWLLREKIGVGSMGAVFAACQTDVSRQVAVKILVEKSLRDRFVREWNVLGRLDHPSLPTYLANGIWKGGEFHGMPYFVMTLLEGKPLSSFASLQLDFEIARDWFLQVVDVVGYLHECHIIHRDIKLDNILLVDHTGRISLVDFGLCKDEFSQNGAMTRVGLGTPDCIAPEQIHNGHDATAASDVYSLACSLFHLLTGRPVFQGPKNVLRCHLEDPPPHAKDIRSDCPEWLDNLFQKMMDKSPGSRPSLNDVRRELSTTRITAHASDAEEKTLAGTVTFANRVGFERDRIFIEFDRDIAIGFYNLIELDISHRPLAAKHFEAALAKWGRITVEKGTPSDARLCALGRLLEEIQKGLAKHLQSCPAEVRPPIHDSLTKLYANVLVFVADSLTPEYLASAASNRSVLSQLRQNIEARLSNWAEAVSGGRPHRSVLDPALCRSLQGPYPSSLPKVLDHFDQHLLDRFHSAIRLRIVQLSDRGDDGISLFEFLSNEAIPFWKDQCELDGRVSPHLAEMVGENLCSILDAVNLETFLVLDAMPQAVKFLQLDERSTTRTEIQEHWPEVTRERLVDRLTEIQTLAAENQEFAGKFNEILSYVRSAVDTNPPRVPRFNLSEGHNGRKVVGELIVRNAPELRTPCELVDISIDMLSVRIRIHRTEVRNVTSNSSDPVKQVYPNVPARYRNDLPLLFGKDGVPELLGNCILEFKFDELALRFNDLESIRWRQLPIPGDGFAREYAAYVWSPEGSLDGFVSYVFRNHGIKLEPAEKLAHNP